MKQTAIALAVVAALTAGITFKAIAAEKAEKSIKDVMKTQMKGDTAPIKKAIKGELSKEEVAQLLADVKVLASSKPPQGEEASWKEKTTALVSACEKLEKGEAGAGDALKAAANCKACHDVHKKK